MDPHREISADPAVFLRTLVLDITIGQEGAYCAPIQYCTARSQEWPGKGDVT